MIEIDFERLRKLGLSPALAPRAFTSCTAADPVAALGLRLFRLVEVHRETVRLHDGLSDCSARVMPRLARRLADEGTALAVGDWVLAATDVADPQGAAWLHDRVPPLEGVESLGHRHLAIFPNVSHRGAVPRRE